LIIGALYNDSEARMQVPTKTFEVLFVYYLFGGIAIPLCGVAGAALFFRFFMPEKQASPPESEVKPTRFGWQGPQFR
jgi:hypothetical protein